MVLPKWLHRCCRPSQQSSNWTSAHTVVKAPKSCHITPILRSLHWLRITERIEYNLLSVSYKVLTTTQPPFLHDIISVQRPRSTRSSSVGTLVQPLSSSSLKITDRSFCCASPCFWNQLPLSLRQPHSGTSSFISDSPVPSPIISSSSDSPLCLSILPLSFTSDLFHKSFPRSLPNCLHGLFFGATRFLFLFFLIFTWHLHISYLWLWFTERNCRIFSPPLYSTPESMWQYGSSITTALLH